MSNIIFNIRHIQLLFLCSIFIVFSFSGCSSDSKATKVSPDAPPRNSTPNVLTPEASGDAVYSNDVVSMDLSNTSEGYLMLTYSGTNEKVKFQISAPDDVTCTYLVTEYNTATAFPLTGGNGDYTFSLLESVDASKNRYALVYTQTTDVILRDEFLPFLTPNVYVNYTEESHCVLKSAELAENCYCDLEVIENIYHYVTGTITYDEKKAKSVTYGYTPDPDKTISAGEGICFDYASLMTAMLRSQRIPTKLEVGYAGETYHAWISCYVDEVGWIDNIIEFNGENWSLMDPTLAANNSSSSVQEYIGDGSKYIVKYTY